jgi:hypothetical protein
MSVPDAPRADKKKFKKNKKTAKIMRDRGLGWADWHSAKSAFLGEKQLPNRVKDIKGLA